MGEFKQMVKMETTEPSVVLKLKKGGSVAHKAMKSGGTCKDTGHKMMDGGMAPTVGTPRGGMAPAMAPKKPSMASRRKAMAKPAMKTGGVVNGQGGYKTGGVVKGQGGYAEGGVIKSTSGKTKVVTATADNSPAKTGDVKLGNGGGYKKGGATKKYASGGSVNDEGRAQKMPQGAKRPSTAVSIDKLSGTFKKGGNVSSKALQAQFKKENAPAMKAAKADSNLKYSKYQKAGKKMADGGRSDVEMSFDESFASPREQLHEMRMRRAMNRGAGQVSDRERESNEAMVDALTSLPREAKALAKRALRGQGAVTDTERTVSRTVTPPLQRKNGGKAKK
jgi:hypothetical protein